MTNPYHRLFPLRFRSRREFASILGVSYDTVKRNITQLEKPIKTASITISR